MHQIGIAIHGYHDSLGVIPRYRICGLPWTNSGGTFGPPTAIIPNLNCDTLTSPSHFTGQNEVWWAPYDNSTNSPLVGVGTSQYTGGTVPNGLIWPWVGQNKNVFKCPLGNDITPGDVNSGKQYQVSYGMNYTTGGPNGKRLIDLINGNGSSAIMIVWDHANTPGCATPRQPRRGHRHGITVTLCRV